MTYIISQICVECVDAGCVDVCPVACIYAPLEATAERPNMLYIHPTECINCGACEPECPWEAIFEDQEVPPARLEDVALNALTMEQPSAFCVAEAPRDSEGRLLRKPLPSRDLVLANRLKWGVEQ